MTKEDAIMMMLTESSLGMAVGGRVFPLAASSGTQTPYVVYSQISRSGSGTKDGDDRLLFLAVSVVSKSYKEAHDLASTVEKVCKEGCEITYDAHLNNPEFESETEMYDTVQDLFMVKTEIGYDYYI